MSVSYNKIDRKIFSCDFFNKEKKETERNKQRNNRPNECQSV